MGAQIARWTLVFNVGGLHTPKTELLGYMEILLLTFAGIIFAILLSQDWILLNVPSTSKTLGTNICF